MKKLFALVAACGLGLSAIGCGGTTETPKAAETPKAGEGSTPAVTPPAGEHGATPPAGETPAPAPAPTGDAPKAP